MNRRTFVQSTLTALCVAPALGFVRPARSMPPWLLDLVKLNDDGLEVLRALQSKEAGTLGGVRDGHDILNPHSTFALALWGSCALFAPSSRYFRSEALREDVRLAAEYLVNTQHPDGTIDLLSTNFHSPPDTAFLVKRLVTAYGLLEKSGTPGVERVLSPLKTFLTRAGEALVVGGIHTPNHRWVVAAALAQLYTRWPDPRYRARAEQWLQERIDIDADGQYNEKSTFIYSSLSDRVLITIARGLPKPELLDHVRKNLDMTMYYVHPNGEIVTDASGRQDKAVVGTLENYYYPYRYLALRDQNGAYAAMCALIERTAGSKLRGYLDYYLADEALWAPLPASKPLPVSYVKTFPHSGLVRIRREQWDSTLIARNPVFFTFMHGQAVLQGLRLAASFFGKGQFQTETLVQKEKSWELTQRLEGPYYQPYPAGQLPTQDGDWEKMPRSGRAQSEVQTLETKVLIRETNHGMEVEISSEGTDRVPVALELIFRPGGTFEGLAPHASLPNTWFMEKGTGTYTFQTDRIRFGPGLHLHKNTALRGALPAMDAPTVFLTGFTPFRQVLTFSAAST